MFANLCAVRTFGLAILHTKLRWDHFFLSIIKVGISLLEVYIKLMFSPWQMSFWVQKLCQRPKFLLVFCQSQWTQRLYKLCRRVHLHSMLPQRDLWPLLIPIPMNAASQHPSRQDLRGPSPRQLRRHLRVFLPMNATRARGGESRAREGGTRTRGGGTRVRGGTRTRGGGTRAREETRTRGGGTRARGGGTGTEMGGDRGRGEGSKRGGRGREEGSRRGELTHWLNQLHQGSPL